MSTLACYSLKGGVGKTASAVNLAWLAAEAGARTLLFDLDPQGAATFTFRVRTKVRGGFEELFGEDGAAAAAVRGSDFERLDVLPADFSMRGIDRVLRPGEADDPLRRLLRSLEDEYDLVVVDAPPSASRVADSLFAAVDRLVVPTIPTPLSLRTLARLMKHLRRSEPRPGVLPFFCMVDQRKSLHRRVIDWERETGLGFLETVVPYSSVLEQMSSRRAPVFAYAPRSAPASAYRALWSELRARLDDDERPRPFGKRKRKAVEAAVRGDELRRPRGR